MKKKKTKNKAVHWTAGITALIVVITIGFVALSLTGCDDGDNTDLLDYTALDTAISSANAAKAGVTISANGADVGTTVQWVTQAQMNTFNNAIDAAEIVRSNATTQAQIDNAVSTLNAVVVTFNNAKKAGTQGVDAPCECEDDCNIEDCDCGCDPNGEPPCECDDDCEITDCECGCDTISGDAPCECCGEDCECEACDDGGCTECDNGNDNGNGEDGDDFIITTDETVLNDTATLGLVGTSVSSSDTSVATADIVSDKIKITSVSAGKAVITISSGSINAAINITVSNTGSIVIGNIQKYVPEQSSTAERWTSSVNQSSSATLDIQVDNNGVCAISVGGTPESNNEADGYYRWRTGAYYSYTAVDNTQYKYTFKAWTESGSGNRFINIQYFWYPGESSFQEYEIELTETEKTYEITGKSVTRSGVTTIGFHCADQLGTFYVQIISIEPVETNTLTITGLEGKSGDVDIVVATHYAQEGMVARGKGTIINGSATVALFKYDNSEWTGTGEHIIFMALSITGDDAYPYTAGKTFEQLGISGQIDGDKLPKYNFTQSASTIDFSDFYYPGSQQNDDPPQNIDPPDTITIRAEGSGPQMWGMYSKPVSPFYTGSFEGNKNYKITLTGTIGLEMDNASFQIFCFYPYSSEPPLNILNSGWSMTFTQGEFELVIEVTSEDFSSLPSNDIYFSIWSQKAWPEDIVAGDDITVITNFNIEIEEN